MRKMTGEARLDDLPLPERFDFCRTVPCLFCGRPAGEKCISMNGNQPHYTTIAVHTARLKLAREHYRMKVNHEV